MTKIGAITVGQSPRVDVTVDVLPIWGDKAELIEAGALDELTYEEILKLTPEHPDDHILVSRLRDGREVTFAEPRIVGYLQDCIDRLEAQGVALIVFFCTGEFPYTFRHNVPIIYPSDILLRVMPALSGGKPITVVTPSKLQLAQLKVKWERYVDKANTLYASPYGDKTALERACCEITETDGELVVLDCIGYTQKMKRDIAAATGKRVILARTMLARAILEMIDA